MICTFSIFSYVVNLRPQLTHSRRRRMARPSSVGRESITRLSVELQYMHFIEPFTSLAALCPLQKTGATKRTVIRRRLLLYLFFHPP